MAARYNLKFGKFGNIKSWHALLLCVKFCNGIGVYTNVFSYLDWAQENMKMN